MNRDKLFRIIEAGLSIGLLVSLVVAIIMLLLGCSTHPPHVQPCPIDWGRGGICDPTPG